MTRSIATAAVMYAVAVSSATAQAAHPNFSGTWVSDPSTYSTTGQMPAAVSATSLAVRHGDTITVDRETTETAGVVKTHSVWAVDGKPWKNTVPINGTDAQLTSVLSWDNSVLVIRSALSMMGTAVELIDRWTMAADGRTFVMVRSGSAGTRDLGTTTLTFVKKN